MLHVHAALMTPDALSRHRKRRKAGQLSFSFILDRNTITFLLLLWERHQ